LLLCSDDHEIIRELIIDIFCKRDLVFFQYITNITVPPYTKTMNKKKSKIYILLHITVHIHVHRLFKIIKKVDDKKKISQMMIWFVPR
jgi:hypothetical protein